MKAIVRFLLLATWIAGVSFGAPVGEDAEPGPERVEAEGAAEIFMPELLAILAKENPGAPGEQKAVDRVLSWMDARLLDPLIRELDEAERAPLQAWLSRKTQRKGETRRTALLLALRPQDDLPRAVKILARLTAEFPKEADACWQLALATALVWDKPRIYSGNNSFNKRKKPEDTDLESLDIPRDLFSYFVSREKGDPEAFKDRPLKEMPWYVALYLVSAHPYLQKEEWDFAWERFRGAKDSRIEDIYRSIKHDSSYVNHGTKKAIAGKEYTLPNLAECGGVCFEETYYAFHTGQAVGIPVSSFVSHNHAWIGALYRTAGRTPEGFAVHDWEMSQTDSAKGLRGGNPGYTPHSKVYNPHPQTNLTLIQDELKSEIDFFQSPRDIRYSIACLHLSRFVPVERKDFRKFLLSRSVRANPLNPYAWKELFQLRQAERLADPERKPAPRNERIPALSFDPDETSYDTGSARIYGGSERDADPAAPYGIRLDEAFRTRSLPSKCEALLRGRPAGPGEILGLLPMQGKPYYSVVFNHFLQYREALLDPRAGRDLTALYKAYLKYLDAFPHQRCLWTLNLARHLQILGDPEGENRLYDTLLEDGRKNPELLTRRRLVSALVLMEAVEVRTRLGLALQPLIQPFETVYAACHKDVQECNNHVYNIRGPGPGGVSTLRLYHEAMIRLYEACGMPEKAAKIRAAHEEILKKS